LCSKAQKKKVGGEQEELRMLHNRIDKLQELLAQSEYGKVAPIVTSNNDGDSALTYFKADKGMV
jgi:hypothetical protein